MPRGKRPVPLPSPPKPIPRPALPFPISANSALATLTDEQLQEAARLTAADLDRLLAQKDFGEWLLQASPHPWQWGWRHLVYIREHLQKVTTGEIKRLAISLSPQHGKSEHTTIRYPIWRLEQDPTLRLAVACYNTDLATEFSRKMRNLAVDRRIPLAKDQQSVQNWATRVGGGLRAVGVGAGIMGKPIDALFIDDPIKSLDEAESQSQRDRVWGWYTNDLYTRLQHDAPVIANLTRWHDDDLIGRILNSEQAKDWVVINIPAEAEENDPLGRQPGEALCPDRFTLEDLHDKRRVMGERQYSALYQGQPHPAGGAKFLREWFVKSLIEEYQIPAFAAESRHWDLAGSKDGDWTVGVRMGRTNDRTFYVTDVIRGRWLPTERDRIIRQTAERDGLRVRVRIGKDPGQAGVSQIAALARQLAGWNVVGIRETGSKETRADAFASQLGAGNVRILRAGWTGAYIDEHVAFPAGKWDDQVDASSSGFNDLIDGVSVYESRGLTILNVVPSVEPRKALAAVGAGAEWKNPDDWAEDD